MFKGDCTGVRFVPAAPVSAEIRHMPAAAVRGGHTERRIDDDHCGDA